ncbi:HNH endonuclease [Fusobacterium necrophorum]|uniref:HNH endonuclease n=1 Tax=Fusobacterium necrophorum TaxID=859 RepID=UPI00055E1285|nr:HNH endonuclease [Fusobacterium necrophorum]
MSLLILDLIKRMNYFIDNYKVLYYIDIPNAGSKNIVKKNQPRICRFCGKGPPEVKFRKKAHAIPELLSNKNILSYDECDECNEFFGLTLEVELAKYLGLERIFLKMNGKKGIPSYKSNDKSARLDVKGDKHILQVSEKNSFIKIDEEKKEITFQEDETKYIPIAVYKSLVKIGISLLPLEELVNFRSTISWLKESSHSKEMNFYAYVLKTVVPMEKRPLSFPLTVTGMLRKNNDFSIPYYQVLIEVKNISFEFIVPCKSKETLIVKRKIEIESIPRTEEIYRNLSIVEMCKKIEDMRSIDFITRNKREFKASYQRLEDLPIDAKDLREVLESLGLNKNKTLKKPE